MQVFMFCVFAVFEVMALPEAETGDAATQACMTHSDCPWTDSCLGEKCENICSKDWDVCGKNADCRIKNHIASCSCQAGTAGDPYAACEKANGCGDGIGCWPECRTQTVHSDCPPDKACIKWTCQNPCDNSCGGNATCRVVNHQPICTCQPGMSGNPYNQCTECKDCNKTDVCQPSPCGPNSVCNDVSGVATCACAIGMIGSPPRCRNPTVDTVPAECGTTDVCSPSPCGETAECIKRSNDCRLAPLCRCPGSKIVRFGIPPKCS